MLTSQQKLQIYRELDNNLSLGFSFALNFFEQTLKKISDEKSAEFKRVIEEMNTEIVQMKLKDGYTPVKGVDYFDGENGQPGADGKTPTREEILSLIKTVLQKGEDGRTPTENELLKIIRPLLPSPEDMMPDEEKLKELILSLMPPDDDSQDEELKKEFEILKKEFEIIKQLPFSKKEKRGKYLHGGGPTITAGAGVVVTTDSSGNITISSSASSAVLAKTSGAIDDSNTVFGFASLPSILNINGAFYQQTGGAITWTWNAGTLQATLSSPVGTNGSIFGIR